MIHPLFLQFKSIHLLPLLSSQCTRYYVVPSFVFFYQQIIVTILRHESINSPCLYLINHYCHGNKGEPRIYLQNMFTCVTQVCSSVSCSNKIVFPPPISLNFCRIFCTLLEVKVHTETCTFFFDKIEARGIQKLRVIIFCRTCQEPQYKSTALPVSVLIVQGILFLFLYLSGLESNADIRSVKMGSV